MEALAAGNGSTKVKYEIQKGVPLPSVHHGRPSMYPFDQLKEKDDCLSISAEPGESLRQLTSRVRNALYSFKTRNKDIRISTRTFRDEMVVKIYRTE